MKRVVLLAATVAALLATAAPAVAGNLTKYDGASWYEKYLSVSGGAPKTCAGNTGEVGQ